MQPFNSDYENISPIELIEEGDAWLKLWESGKSELKTLLPAVHCLFTALEFYLKAYIALKDNSYSDVNKLKRLGHRFDLMYEQAQRVSNKKTSSQLLVQLKKYQLLELKLDLLKYPQSGQFWMLNRDLASRSHSLGPIFELIKTEVAANPKQWLKTKYPKELQTSLIFRLDFETSLSKLTHDERHALANTCSNCLPVGAMVSEHYGFPWHNEAIPPRNCTVCNELFIPRAREVRYQEKD